MKVQIPKINYLQAIADVLRREHLKGNLDFDKMALEVYKEIIPLRKRKEDNIQTY